MQKRIHSDFPDYWVFEDGLVVRRVDGPRGVKAGDVVNGRVLKSGYRQHKLVCAGGGRLLVRTNRLVCEAFHGAPPTSKHHAAHKDGNRLNNAAINLYWASPKQNKRDAIRHGTSVKGRAVFNQHGQAKLHPRAVASIRDEYTGERGQLIRLARKYGVGVTAIKNVVNGVTWRWVDRSALDRKQQEQHA